MFKDDIGYWVHGKEIARFEDEELIEIRLTREMIRERREELRGDPRVDLRYSGTDLDHGAFLNGRRHDPGRGSS